MKKVAAALVALAFCAGNAAGADGELSLGVGFNYSEGDYGTSQTTSITSIPVTARYEVDRWILKLTVPWIRVSGPSSVIPGVGQTSNANPNARGRGQGGGGAAGTTTTGTESGLGDIVASVTYGAYFDKVSRFGVDVTGKVKFGTADADKGLGTGENDLSILVEPFKTFDRWTVFGSVGYHMLGATSFFPTDDVFSASIGGSYKFNDRDTAGVSYDWRDKVTTGGSNISELTLFYSRKFDRQWKGQVYVLKGFSNGSPDWGIGASASYAF
jgi:hypothetical protein